MCDFDPAKIKIIDDWKDENFSLHFWEYPLDLPHTDHADFFNFLFYKLNGCSKNKSSYDR